MVFDLYREFCAASSRCLASRISVCTQNRTNWTKFPSLELVSSWSFHLTLSSRWPRRGSACLLHNITILSEDSITYWLVSIIYWDSLSRVVVIVCEGFSPGARNWLIQTIAVRWWWSFAWTLAFWDIFTHALNGLFTKCPYSCPCTDWRAKNCGAKNTQACQVAPSSCLV